MTDEPKPPEMPGSRSQRVHILPRPDLKALCAAGDIEQLLDLGFDLEHLRDIGMLPRLQREPDHSAASQQMTWWRLPLSPLQNRLCILGAVLALGATVGLFLGFVISFHGLGNASSVEAGKWFQMWIQRPTWYWPWPLFGMAVAGLSLLVAGLIRSN